MNLIQKGRIPQGVTFLNRFAGDNTALLLAGTGSLWVRLLGIPLQTTNVRVRLYGPDRHRYGSAKDFRKAIRSSRQRSNTRQI